MRIDELDIIVERRITYIKQVLQSKGKEYISGGDRLDNFRRAADLLCVTSKQALLGFVAKHIVALYDFAQRPDDDVSYGQWEEKIGDIINYMILLDALITETINYDLKVKGVLE